MKDMIKNVVAELSKSPDFKRLIFVLGLLGLWLWSTKSNELVKIKTIFKKMMFWFDSIIYMILAKDNKGLGVKYQQVNTAPDPIHVKKNIGDTKVKRLIFIRHGESDWNSVFNKGKNIGMLFRLIYAVLTEWSMIFSLDSPFLDSPLNEEGIQQALELRKYLEEDHEGDSESQKEILAILRGEKGSSTIVSSTLRRAISTTTLAIWPRIQRTGEKIHLLSYAQEISRNVDTCSLSATNTVPDLPFSRVVPHCADINTSAFNTSLNLGNKGLKFYGKSRIESFNKWLFECNEDTIIVGGHSLWFKCFFNLYLPFESTHRSKSEKLTNSGVIAFNIHKANDQKSYMIDENSIETIYGGFTKK